jgi:hypothetical protein
LVLSLVLSLVLFLLLLCALFSAKLAQPKTLLVAAITSMALTQGNEFVLVLFSFTSKPLSIR